MASLFFTSDGIGGLYRISTDEDKASMGINEANYTVKQISNSDFQLIKNNTKYAELHGDTVSYTDKVVDFEDANALRSYLNQIKSELNSSIEGRPSNPMVTALSSYKDYIDTFDVNSLTYPLGKSWEKYCEDNSITYFNTLQIP